MTRKTLSFVVLIGIAVLAGCYYDRGASFDRTVAIEYNQYLVGPYDDVTFHFRKAGSYVVSFAIPPQGMGRNQERFLPEKFTLVVQDVPRVLKVEQPFLPDFLQVTVTRDGEAVMSRVYR